MHIQGRPVRTHAGSRKRFNLGVGRTRLAVVSLPDDAAALHDDSPNHRVGKCLSETLAGKPEGHPQIPHVERGKTVHMATLNGADGRASAFLWTGSGGSLRCEPS